MVARLKMTMIRHRARLARMIRSSGAPEMA
jgi:hypothetical protein